MSIPSTLRSLKVRRDLGCDSQHCPPHARVWPRQPGLKKAPGNVTFFLRRCNGRRRPRDFSCWPIQRLGVVTVRSNATACLLPWVDRILAPSLADGGLPSASPELPAPTVLPFPHLQKGGGQIPSSSLLISRTPVLPTRTPRSYRRHSLDKIQ